MITSSHLHGKLVDDQYSVVDSIEIIGTHASQGGQHPPHDDLQNIPSPILLIMQPLI